MKHAAASSRCISIASPSNISLSRTKNNLKPTFSISPNKPKTQPGVIVNGRCRANLITDPEHFQVGRLIGSYGYMNITSYSGLQSMPDMGFLTGDSGGQLRAQDVGEGSVKIRLYEGRVINGPQKGTSVIFKVYPGQLAGGLEADMMAANELSNHTFLQSSSTGICDNLVILIGGFETRTGEQWLVFRNDGIYSAADYGKASSMKMSKSSYLGEQISWNYFGKKEIIKRKRRYIIKLFKGVMAGLAFMHNHDRLHQSLGPSSVVLNTIREKDAAYLVPRLRDLAFSVDISYSSLEERGPVFNEEVWRRAARAGALTPMEKRAFGIADDIYEAGLLLSYLAFVPFCEEGIMDSLSLQRLLENTFQLDIEAVREYCLADDRLLEAVNFLDLGEGAGWELLQAMLKPDFRDRPTAEAVICHQFMASALL